MKKGINSEYDKLRNELFELRYKLKLLEMGNEDKSDVEKEIKNHVDRMTKIEMDNIRKKER